MRLQARNEKYLESSKISRAAEIVLFVVLFAEETLPHPTSLLLPSKKSYICCHHDRCHHCCCCCGRIPHLHCCQAPSQCHCWNPPPHLPVSCEVSFLNRSKVWLGVHLHGNVVWCILFLQDEIYEFLGLFLLFATIAWFGCLAKSSELDPVFHFLKCCWAVAHCNLQFVHDSSSRTSEIKIYCFNKFCHFVVEKQTEFGFYSQSGMCINPNTGTFAQEDP